MKDSGIIIHELHCEILELKKELEVLKKSMGSSTDFYSSLKKLGVDAVKVETVTIPFDGSKMTMRRYAPLKSSEG
jgi:hypothetical protein